MKPLDNPELEARLQRLMDLGERTIAALLFSIMAIRTIPSLVAKPANAIVLLSEGMVVLFMLIRRRPLDVTTRPLDWIAAVVATALPLTLRPGGATLGDVRLAATLGLCGLILSIWAKLTLSRSFGMAAANRGVVSGGPYRFVRHPMYAGYVLVDLSFVLLNPVPWNAFVVVVTFVCQVFRILAEERILGRDPAYGVVAEAAPYRIFPGIF